MYKTVDNSYVITLDDDNNDLRHKERSKYR